MVGRISFFLDIKKAENMDQIDLFWLVDPSKPWLLPSPRQTLQSQVALPEFEEPLTLSELFRIEE
jgi:hypothetical protein